MLARIIVVDYGGGAIAGGIGHANRRGGGRVQRDRDHG